MSNGILIFIEHKGGVEVCAARDHEQAELLLRLKVRGRIEGVQVHGVAGHPGLGQWQGIYLFEHREGAHRRRVVVHLNA